MRLPISPRDTFVSAALRFAIELVSVFAIGAAFGLINFGISVAAIWLFNVKGDKRFVGIQVSVPIRLMIEIVVEMLGIYSVGLVWGTTLLLVFGVVWLVYLFLARERLLWLAHGAKVVRK